MRKQGMLRLIWLALLLGTLAMGWAGAHVPPVFAQGPPPRPSPPPQPPTAPPDRPTPPPPPGPAGPTVPGQHGASEGAPSAPCSTLHGFVLNWGYRNEPKLPVTLTGDSWRSQKLTDDNGYYGFECLGIGIGLVNPVLSPDLHSLTSDVAIRLGYQSDFEVNLGLHGGQVVPVLEVVPTLAVSPGGVLPGETLTYTIAVVNTPAPSVTDPHAMEGVMITDLLPDSLLPVRATSTVGAVELWGNLLTAGVGDMSPGQAVTVTLVARVRESTLPGTAIVNRASLIYHDHVASQTQPVGVTVGGQGRVTSEQPAMLPVTGGAFPGDDEADGSLPE
jgi:uncharacterized repeat protein (TIGR01451 family)